MCKYSLFKFPDPTCNHLAAIASHLCPEHSDRDHVLFQDPDLESFTINMIFSKPGHPVERAALVLQVQEDPDDTKIVSKSTRQVLKNFHMVETFYCIFYPSCKKMTSVYLSGWPFLETKCGACSVFGKWDAERSLSASRDFLHAEEIEKYTRQWWIWKRNHMKDYENKFKLKHKVVEKVMKNGDEDFLHLKGRKRKNNGGKKLVKRAEKSYRKNQL